MTMMDDEEIKNKARFKRQSKSQPDISVVLPTRNRPELLREALESLCAQRKVKFEVIIVNDAGCEVAGVVEQFGESLDLSYISLTENCGSAAVRNKACRLARGRYFAYLDDDDLFYPHHLSRLSAKLDQASDVGLVYADVLLLKQELAADGAYRVIGRRTLAQDYDRATMLHDCFIAPSAVMHRRECFERLGGYDETMRWCYEDWDFLMRVDEHYKIERVAGVSVVVRLRNDGSNMSSVVKPERLAAARLLQSRYGMGEIEPKTFWEVADTLARQRGAF
jgi:glycosyltransferase involved in cell wall biosynthesis